jgi:hypothetical protein
MRIAQYTTDLATLLVPVYLRNRSGRYTGTLAGAEITFTPPGGGTASPRFILFSRGYGRYELQLTADDALQLGTAWLDVTSPAGLWFDACIPIEIYVGNVAPPAPPEAVVVQDRSTTVYNTKSSPVRQPRSRAHARARRR